MFWNRESLRRLRLRQVFPYILLVTAAIGLVASFILTLEHIHILEDPNYQPTCSINPILSCGLIMASDTATQFGFPNPLMGLISFSAQALIGLVLLAGAKMKAWFWKLWGLQILASAGFTLFLMYESIFVIRALCIYCMAVWAALSVSSWYTLQYMMAENYLWRSGGKRVTWLRKYHGDILLAWFLLLAALILWEFWYFFGPKFGF